MQWILDYWCEYCQKITKHDSLKCESCVESVKVKKMIDESFDKLRNS